MVSFFKGVARWCSRTPIKTTTPRSATRRVFLGFNLNAKTTVLLIKQERHLNFHQLKDTLPHFNIEDNTYFAEHVIAYIENCEYGDYSPEEYLGFNQFRPEEQQHLLLEKVWLLLQELVYRDQDRMVLHALIALKCLYHTANERFSIAAVDAGHRRIDQLIKAFVASEMPASADGHHSIVHQPQGRSEHGIYFYNADGLKWTSYPYLARYYWNLSSAVRTLHAQYFKIEPPTCGHDDEDPYFHTLSLSMLEWLQKKAWTEVIKKVMLTIGVVLPTELAETIFEYALVAEDIPTDPRVKETIMVDPKEWLDEDEMESRNIREPRPFTRTKPLYHCKGLREKRPESLFEYRPPTRSIFYRG